MNWNSVVITSPSPTTAPQSSFFNIGFPREVAHVLVGIWCLWCCRWRWRRYYYWISVHDLLRVIVFYWTVFRFIFCSGWRPPLLFFTGSWDNTVRIWDVASHQQLAELRGHTSTVTSVAFDGSGKYLASGDVAEAWSVLELVFPPFLACCADAVMRSISMLHLMMKMVLRRRRFDVCV